MKRVIIATLLLFIARHSSSQWVQTNGPFYQYVPSGPIVRALAAIGDTIFATTDQDGLVYSINNGSTWNIVKGITTSGPLLASGHTLYAGAGNRIYRSSDAGKDWDTLTLPFDQTSFTSIASIAISNGTLIASTGFTSYLYASTDNGVTWTDSLALSTDTGRSWYEKPVWQVQNLAATPSIVYAGLGGHGVAVSTDNGFHWIVVTTAPDNVNSLAIFNGTVFAAARNGIFSSSDNGTTWIRDTVGLPDYEYCLCECNGDLFAGSANGVYSSSDHGASWSKCPDSGMKVPVVYSLLALNGSIFAGTDGSGVARSDDNGIHWSGYSAPPKTITTQISAIDTTLENVFACTSAGFYSTRDSGKSWFPDSAGIGEAPINGVMELGTTLFAYGGSSYLSGIFRSSNGGYSWTAVPKMNFTITSMTSFNGVLFAAQDQGYVYKSSDSGITWSNAGFNGYGIGAATVALQPIGMNFIAATNAGLYYSPDTCKNWYVVQDEPQFAKVIGFATMGTIIFAASNDGIWCSTDSGMDWNTCNNGLSDLNVTSFLESRGKLYAGTATDTIFVSTDSGRNWTRLSDEIPYYQSVIALAIKDGILYAGVPDTGIWRYTLRLPDSIKSSVALTPDLQTHSLSSRSYPDPSHDFVHVNILSDDGRTTAHVYNSDLQDLQTPTKLTGSILTIDVRSLPAGSYFLQVKGASGYIDFVRFSREP